MTPTRPIARTDLEFAQTVHEGKRILVVQDPLGISKEPICLSEFGALLLSLLDGLRDLDEIAEFLSGIRGGSLPEGLLQESIAEFAAMGLLLGPEYEARREAVVGGFLRSGVRPPAHQGQAYPEEPELLSAWLESVVGTSAPRSSRPPRIIVAPHIDFRVNTGAYASAYGTLRGCSYDRVVLLGTGHSIHEGLYCPTRKNYVTPLGETRTDSEAVAKLLAAGNGVLSPDDWPHRTEHALEFQVLFLQHVLGVTNFELVPVLCGSMADLLDSTTRLRDWKPVEPFLDALRSIIEDPGKRTLVVAGVDFSHVGLRFSHDVPAKELLEQTKRHDRELMDRFLAGDAEGFWACESKSAGQFNVCGFSSLSTLLECLQWGQGEQLDYQIWDDSPTGSAVSFAALTV